MVRELGSSLNDGLGALYVRASSLPASKVAIANIAKRLPYKIFRRAGEFFACLFAFVIIIIITSSTARRRREPSSLD
jgi:hypothetical protein